MCAREFLASLSSCSLVGPVAVARFRCRSCTAEPISRLNHLLRRTTASLPRQPPWTSRRRAQANRLTRKFRTPCSVSSVRLSRFSFPLPGYIAPYAASRPSGVPSICQLGTMYRRGATYAKQFSEFISLRRRPFSRNNAAEHRESPIIISFPPCNNQNQERERIRTKRNRCTMYISHIYKKLFRSLICYTFETRYKESS